MQAPDEVYMGDHFTVKFSVNDQAKDFHGPSFKGFSLIAGPSTSSQTSMSFINGQMSRSVSTSFSYTLMADVEGTFTVEPASCVADGKKISSKRFTIKVIKMSAAQQQQRQYSGNGSPHNHRSLRSSGIFLCFSCREVCQFHYNR